MDQPAVTIMQDDDGPLRITLRDGVGTIELSRPAVFNCLSQRMLSEIGAAIAAFEHDGARAVLIVADGSNFCTGAALDEVEAVRGGEAGRGRCAGTLPGRRR
jgi:enoyl-CoA hydratase/carnithine racemase